jgi:hypothetical protein
MRNVLIQWHCHRVTTDSECGSYNNRLPVSEWLGSDDGAISLNEFTTDRVSKIVFLNSKLKLKTCNKAAIRSLLQQCCPAHEQQQYVRTEYLLNTRLERYRCTNLLNVSFFFNNSNLNQFTTHNRLFELLHLSLATSLLGFETLGHSVTQAVRLLMSIVTHSVDDSAILIQSLAHYPSLIYSESNNFLFTY